jgi:hypothetical protein
MISTGTCLFAHWRMTKTAGIEHSFDVNDLQDNKASDLDLTAEEIRTPLKTLSYLYILS